MRKALIVGIDRYDHLPPLGGCVNDAHSVKAALERHADGTLNFTSPHVLTSADVARSASKRSLKDAVRELYASDGEIALFYFAGHGYIEDTGGFLCAADSLSGDDGLALSEVMTFVNESRARNRLVILDSCYSGIVANSPNAPGLAVIRDGVTILTASTSEQAAFETPDGKSGVFSSLFVDALNGAAANLVGDITPGSVYAHIDQSLGPWAQRPIFKTNVKSFVSLRKAKPPISLRELQSLIVYFPTPDYELRLDPSFEPERSPEQLADASTPPPDPVNTRTFGVLQDYVRVNLVRPVGAPHMWHAAMQSKSCKLTVLGHHYWNLVRKGLV